MIIEAEELKQKINGHQLHLLDVRALANYENSHIPGAIHFDASQANASDGLLKGLLPDRQMFEQYVRSKGINQNTPIVIYDDKGGPAAGRLVWTLLTYGHNNASLLNGGWCAWQAAAYPENTELATATANGDFKATLVDDFVAEQHNIMSKLDDVGTVFLDARSFEEYTGADLRSKRGGHIPGAIHFNWAGTKDPENSAKFKSTQWLKARLHEKGITADKEIIAYCQTHQRSAIFWVLLKSLGYANVKGYPAAWSDWGNSETAPIEA